MEPDRQVEIQLGHMCNNRCVFCVSGQRTGLGLAHPLAAAPILAQIDAARAQGMRKITLLGGEPTLQPAFMEIVRHTVALGFDEIVIFTNGVKTPRESFIDEVLATGGNFTWRISIQGATEEAHDRTTRRPGSFARIVRSMEHLQRKGQRLTVNMCVVGSNFESVDAFPGLLAPFGVRQLHLDLVRPADAGERTPEELDALLPRYGRLVPGLTAMVEGFGRAAPELDLNIGNLPYCIAPELAPWIHHDGETTLTIAVDGDEELSEPWDKYAVKRRDKLKPESCRRCVFDDRCSGVFAAYRDRHGLEELQPIGPERLRHADPTGRLLARQLVPLLAELTAPTPFTAVVVAETGEREVTVTFTAATERLQLALRPPGGGAAGFDRCSVHVLRAPGDPAAARAGLAALWQRLSDGGLVGVHPPGDELGASLPVSVSARLGRLRAHAPFGALRWTALRAAAGRAELTLSGPGGEGLVFWLDESDGVPTGGYRLSAPPATPQARAEVEAAVAAMVGALR